jgi:hypothetical protein
VLNVTSRMGIVQVRPTRRGPGPHRFVLSSLPSRRERREEKRGIPGAPLCRLDLNDPPTSVGGILGHVVLAFVCRLHLNDPPTSVGGIPGVFAQSRPWVVFPDTVSSGWGISRLFTHSLKAVVE